VEALGACEKTMRELGYSEIERWERTYRETIDVDFVVGHILSATSAEQIPATQRDEFADAIRTAIEASTPSGLISENLPVRAVLGRPPAIGAA
jgi:hypothetical protein